MLLDQLVLLVPLARAELVPLEPKVVQVLLAQMDQLVLLAQVLRVLLGLKVVQVPLAQMVRLDRLALPGLVELVLRDHKVLPDKVLLAQLEILVMTVVQERRVLLDHKVLRDNPEYRQLKEAQVLQVIRA